MKDKLPASTEPSLQTEDISKETGLPGESCPIVAIGASAGGLESFQRFFDHMPSDSGMAFVLIQHLDPHHETLIPELLAKHTSMPIVKVEETLQPEANRIYVIKSGIPVMMESCSLKAGAGSQNMVIDYFFRSLSEGQHEAVIGIILSGTGSDGTMGLKAIKENGGLTLAEAPETAKHDSMPRSAISSGLVDYVLPPEDMPEKVLKYVSHLRGFFQGQRLESIQEEAPRLLKKLYPILRRHTSHDFSRYKQSTLLRRVQRRMQLRYATSMSAYLDVLRKEPEEVEALFKDLLIGVTQFFRDGEAFAALEKRVIPDIFDGKRDDGRVRVWVPGCATGEEAYSIAMLLAEQRGRRSKMKIQIFGTDLDMEALNFARKARYPEYMAEHLTAERLRRFFRRDDCTYEVCEEIREMCVFSPHNLIKDPPFSHLDLISCRNLLIYLEMDLQKRVLPIFHYGLNPAGYLFLGPSESLASRSELFRPIDKKHRLFQRCASRLHESVHVPLPDGGRANRIHAPVPSNLPPMREFNQARIIERVILEDYAAPSVIVDAQGEVVYFSGHTSRFLEPQAGTPSNKLINMARKGLRIELRTALYRAMTNHEEVLRENLLLKVGQENRRFNLMVRPLTELGKDAELFIVLFHELIQPPEAPVPTREIPPEIQFPLVQQLENELRTTREDLQTAIEELESSNEDLKSANEELLSMNEELQSTNEELQTSKEEIQSANDELQKKNEELDATNADLQNLFQSTEVATVFVDSQLRIKRFTPVLTNVFRVLDRDLGRSLLDVAPELALKQDLEMRIQQVMRTQSPYQWQITLGGRSQWFMVRINPYRTMEHVVQGAVITFTDITELKRAEREHSQLAAIVESSQDAIISKDLDGIITSWNDAAARLYGYTAEEAIGKSILLIIPNHLYNEEAHILDQIRRGERVSHFETVRRRKDGTLVDISLTVSPVRDAEGKIIGASKIARNVSERKRTEQSLELARERLAKANTSLEQQVQLRTAELVEVNNQLEAFVYSIAHDLRAPLRSMQAFASILLEDFGSQLDPTARDYAQRISRSAVTMDRLLLDLLAFGRIARSEMDLEAVDVASAWRAAVAQNEDVIREKQARVEAIPALPPVKAHEATLTQALANLLSNALKFVAPGVTPHVRLWAETASETVRLWVEDNGIGIAREHHERVFRIFERLQRAEYASGTGIGLAIVRKGVERMGGRVGLDSDAGQGCRFWIELPKG